MSGKCNGMIAGVSWTSCLVLFLSAVLLMPMPAFAFKPTAGHGHAGIILEVLQSLEVKTKEGYILKFSERARREVIEAAEAVDYVRGDKAEFIGHPEAHCDDETLVQCSQRIIDLKNAVIEQLTKDEKPSQARAELGRALHTLQDFYAHTNWVNVPGPAKTTINMELGRNKIATLGADMNTCVDDVWDNTLVDEGLRYITSGYFALRPGAEPPSGKCAHGWGDWRNEPYDTGAGINKCYPVRRFFAEARNLAKLATVDFINQVLESPGIIGDTLIIQSLLDHHGSLGFVVDDTESMSPTINGVKKVIAKIVQDVKDDPSRKPEGYILVRFGDKDVGAPFITKSADALLAKVNALTAHEGGDCPESSMGGLLTAINAASPLSTIHLFTDASAKDAKLSINVDAAAMKKKILVSIVSTGSCSPIDPTYGEITRETGGQLVVLNNTEADVEKYFEIIQPTLKGDLEPLMIVADTLASTAGRYNIYVDSTITNLLVSVNMDSKGSIQLFRPNGTEVLTGNGDASITELPNGRIVKVSAPAAGLWQLSIGGTPGTRYSASVMGNSPIRLDRFQFVESKGNVGHLGLFRIDGQPISGATSTAVATLYGPYDQGTPPIFQLISEPGILLATPTLSSGDSDATDEDFVGTVTLPIERFRVYVLGKDAKGFWFRRALPPTFIGQAVQVEALHKESDLEMIAGKPFTARFKVTNRGSDNKFKISAADDRGFVKSVSQSEVTLAANASAQIDVALDIPGVTAADTVVMLSLVATGTTTPSTENYAVFSRTVEVRPPEGTGGTSGGGGGGGGCFIATAVYGPGRAEEIELLKRFRDEYLLTNPVGRALVRVYYRYSPPAAAYLERHGAAKTVTRTALKPLVFGLKHPMLCLFSACFLVGMAFTWRKRGRNKY